MPGRHKAPLLGWHPPAELAVWAREEAERRGGGRGALSDLLTEALAEKRDRPVTDDMIDRAWNALSQEIAPPYMARVKNYVSDDSTGAEREREIATLKAADEDADRRNRDLIRRALAAALGGP